MILRYSKKVKLEQLLEELLKIEVLKPRVNIKGELESTFILEEDEEQIYIRLEIELNAEEIKLIEEVIENHVPIKGIKEPDWEGLERTLTGTPVFLRVFREAPANAWTLLLTSITTTNNINTMQLALAAVREGMVNDFNEEEKRVINIALTMYSFPFNII